MDLYTMRKWRVNGGGMVLQQNAIVFILYRLLTKFW
jgi:hypothetical protein